MKLIAAVDKNWAIGNKGQLLVSIPQDQKMFRNETMGKVIVMGRKHWKACRARSRFMAGPTLCLPPTRIIKLREPLYAAVWKR